MLLVAVEVVAVAEEVVAVAEEVAVVVEVDREVTVAVLLVDEHVKENRAVHVVVLQGSSACVATASSAPHQ